MSRDKFAALLDKYQEGKCNDQEKQLVEYWFALIDTNAAPETTEEELNGVADRMWSRIQEAAPTDFAESRPPVPLRNIFVKWIGIAASLVLVTWFILGGRFGKMFDTGTNAAEYSWVEKTNEGVTNMIVTLEDSSIVELSPRSSLRFPDHFDDSQRIVKLEGKAFFKIQKNPKKPFYVHSGQMVTRVLGTSFYVRNEPKTTKTSVEVVTGLVSVYGAKENGKSDNPLLLKPNHKATFNAASETFSVGLAERPRLVNENIAFQFQNEPLSKVVENMTAAWGVEIQTDNKQILNCPLTADLSGQPLFIQLDIICAALNARYKITGTTIRIWGEGCRQAKIRSSIHSKPIHSDM